MKEKIAKLKNDATATKAQVDKLLHNIGNIVHSSVPFSKDEKDNDIVKYYKKEEAVKKPGRHHHEILYMLGGVDYERGAKVAGHRGCAH